MRSRPEITLILPPGDGPSQDEARNFFDKKGYHVRVPINLQNIIYITLSTETTLSDVFREFITTHYKKNIDNFENEIKKELTRHNIPYNTIEEINDKQRREELNNKNRLEIEKLHKLICLELKEEMKDFLNRKEKDKFSDLTSNEKERYKVLTSLETEITTIKTQTENYLDKDNWKEQYRNNLNTAISSSLKNEPLDKYNELEKVGLTLLNLITFLFSPIKRAFSGTWFFSTEGKSKETVRKIQETVNNHAFSTVNQNP